MRTVGHETTMKHMLHSGHLLKRHIKIGIYFTYLFYSFSSNRPNSNRFSFDNVCRMFKSGSLSERTLWTRATKKATPSPLPSRDHARLSCARPVSRMRVTVLDTLLWTQYTCHRRIFRQLLDALTHFTNTPEMFR